MINALAAIHKTTPFGADAEVFGDLLLTMDSFSEKEDFFSVTPPERIGHNMAAAVLSDLLACGIRGEFLINCWNMDEKHTYVKSGTGPMTKWEQAGLRYHKSVITDLDKSTGAGTDI